MNDPSFQREVLDRLIKLETLLQQQDYKGLKERVEDDHEKIVKDEQISKDHEKRITKIEENNKWLWRLVIGALITGAMAILFGI